MQDAILILDHDPALAGLIARTLRSQQVYCEPVPFTLTLSEAKRLNARGLIIAARNEQVVSLAGFDLSLLTAELPMLALGGMVPALCEHFGGRVLQRENENDSVTLGLSENPLFEGMSPGERVLHNLCDLALPEGFDCLATATERCIGFSREATELYAVQYPIERNDPDAVQLLRNFACQVCGMIPLWTEAYIIEQAVEALKTSAGEGRVLCAVSGGVDSAVCARLARMAVGDRLICVFVDTGLLRKNEPETVIECYMETLGLVVAYVDARETFLKALTGVRTAAEKERITSSLLRQVFVKQLSYDPGVHTLVLGTTYNDTLYGAAQPDCLIHTGGDAPLCTVEPVRGLFKDEIRRLGRALSLPGTVVERQPFPASGLALRVMGDVTGERLAILRTADALFSEEIRAGGHERRLWQYYATLTPSQDEREGYEITLRACHASNSSANAARLPYDMLERVVERIQAALPNVIRVTYDMTPSSNYAFME